MLTIPSHVDVDKLDRELTEAFHMVDFIGELPIRKEDFHNLASVVRRVGLVHGKVQPDKVPASVFATSMVFCARYSETNARNFWKPYAQLVWSQSHASQSFQNKCRTRFIQCRRKLSRSIGFNFPVQSEGDVVRPVYRHAIIPYYLEDHFAQWLKVNLSAISQLPAEDLPILLRGDKSLTYVPPTLCNFIQNEETAETAAALIETLAVAANLYLEGENVEDIAAMMSSPIEQALWRELANALVEQSRAGDLVRQPRVHLEWVWSLDDGEMYLRLLNLVTDRPPDRCVWVNQDEDPKYADRVTYLDPWRYPDGTWQINESMLSDGSPDGMIYVLDEMDEVCYQASVPPLPETPFALFRRTQQGMFGVPVSHQHRLSDGPWLFSMQAGVRLTNTDGQLLQPDHTYAVPEQLRHKYTQAAQYTLHLPVTVYQGDEVYTVLEPKEINVGQPVIEGDHSVKYLSMRVPPAFTSRHIRLRIPSFTQRLSRLTLWLKAGITHIQRPLTELEAAGQLTREENGYVIDLSTVLPYDAATYRLDLRRNVQPMLSEPLYFSVLPGVEITPPDPGQIYSIGNLPQITISNIAPEHIQVTRAKVSTKADGVHITWQNLRTEDYYVQFQLPHQRISLAWSLQRVYAWVSDVEDAEHLKNDELTTAVLHVRGTRDQPFNLWLEGSSRVREETLNTKGRYDYLIRDTTLYDMLRLHSSARVEVWIKIGGVRWQLFDLVRHPEIGQLYLDYEAGTVFFSCQTGRVWQGQFDIQLRSLDRPFANPIPLAETTSLKEFMLAKSLEPGAYLLEINCEGYRIPLKHPEALLQVGSGTKTLYTSPEAVSHALAHLREPKNTSLSSDAARVFVQLLDNHCQHTHAVFSRDHLYSLSTQPIDVYLDLKPEQLRRLWSPLERLVQVHQDITMWHSDGLLPAWAVLSQPLWFELSERGNRLKIYPELAAEKGRRGKGRTKLTLLEDKIVWAYAAWEPYDQRQLRLTLAIPDPETSGPFAAVDVLDMWPVYQCTQCGRLVGEPNAYKHTLNTEVRQAHRHQRGEPEFRDVTYDHPLLAYLHLGRSDRPMRFVYGPHQVVDRQRVFDWLEKRLYHLPPQDGPPTTKAGYLAAAHDWITRQTSSREHAHILDALVTNRRWQAGLARLAAILRDSVWLDNPMLGATTRLMMNALQWQPKEQPLMALDETILMLALVLRMQAYYKKTGQRLTELTQLTPEDFRHMLGDAAQACPKLLEWALTWVEMFHVHTLI